MQEQPGHNPVPRALGRSCLSREVQPDDPISGPFQPYPFYDPGIL